MEEQELIYLETFCRFQDIETSFIYSLEESGLVNIVTKNQSQYLIKSELYAIEKIIRIHNDLEINSNGVGVILHLLDKIHDLNAELTNVKKRLEIYE